MKMPPEQIPVWGDVKYRGACPREAVEQMTFFSELRRRYPDIGRIALHPKNEGRVSGAGFQALAKDKAMGLSVGAPDIVIPLGFCCELKRRDHTKSRIGQAQIDYMLKFQALGGYACVALGWEAAMNAFVSWYEVF